MKYLIYLLKQWFFSSLSLLATGLIVLGLAMVYFSWDLPDVGRLKHVDYQVPLMIYANDGQLMAEYGEKRRIPVAFNTIPKTLINAVLATEDKRFYEHSGVDVLGLARATIVLVTTGKKLEGASTITMQVARNFFLSRKKTYVRKIKEILLALKIDQTISKQQVLSLYLNKIYFGQRAYGVGAAAFTYYGVSLDQLTLPQMAMLAGLPKAPSANNPLNNPQRALSRRNHVLWRMWQANYIDQATYQQAIRAPITAAYHYRKPSVNAPYAAEMVRQAMIAKYGKHAYTDGLKVYTTIRPALQKMATTSVQQGLIAYARRHGYYGALANLGVPNLDDLSAWMEQLKAYQSIAGLQAVAILQVNAQDNSATGLLQNGQTIQLPWVGINWAKPFLGGGWSPRPKAVTQVLHVGDVVYVQKVGTQWQLSERPKVQGALLSLNPQNGAIFALTGGFSFDQTHYNRVTQALRQPGSSFKPFVYSAALNQGFTLASTMNDAPIVRSQDTGENSLWRPHNDTQVFYGPTRLRVGLTQSRNLVSIRLLQAMGIDYALNYVKRFGFDADTLPHGLSLALGAGSITPMALGQGYAVFANGGFRVQPFVIRQIIERGKLVYQVTPETACYLCQDQQKQLRIADGGRLAARVLTPQNAYLMDNVMQDVIKHGTGKGALVLHRTDLAGKTGTTNNQMDGWFAGFNPQMVTITWVGYDQPQSLYEYGAKSALPIWIQYMRGALPLLSPKKQASWLKEPTGLVSVRIDAKTGQLAQVSDHNAIYELFRQRYAPKVNNTNLPVSSNVDNTTGESENDQTLF